MTSKIPFTQAGLKRAIKAARDAGLRVTGIKPDGTVLVEEHGAHATHAVDNDWNFETAGQPAEPRSAEDNLRALAGRPIFDGGYAFNAEEYAEYLRAKPLSKRERDALDLFFDRPEGSVIRCTERGAGLHTMQRLAARGYLTPLPAEKGRVPDHTITQAGKDALLLLRSSRTT